MNRRLNFIFSLLVGFSVFFSAVQIQSATNDDKPNQPLPFQLNEELYFEGEFTKAILRGINIGEMKLRITQSPNQTNTEKQTQNYNITGEIVSKGFATKLFGINFHQLIETTVDPTNFRVVKDNKLDEQGKRIRKSETVIDKENGKITWTETNANLVNPTPRVLTIEFKGDVQNLATAFYYLRLQPLKVGQSFTVPIHDSGRVYNVAVKVTQRKQMKTAVGKVWAVRTELDIFGENKLIDGKGSAALWFTDDERKIPVHLQVKNDSGTIDFKLKKMAAKKDVLP